MIQDIENIQFRSGLLEKGTKVADLPVIVFKGSSIPGILHKAVRETDILNCGGEYGDASFGDPVQYDNLIIQLTDETMEITFYNRAITLFATNDDKIRRIHQFMCSVEDIGKAEPKV